MTDIDAVLVERDGPVTIVSINRPHCRNAVDGATARKLFDAFRTFDADASASVAVFTGTGGYFCAGADLKAVAAGDPNKKREIGGHDTIAPMGPSRLRLSKPVIAAVEGFAVAGGMELALWADMRVVAEDATFGIFCRRFGVPLIDLGTIRPARRPAFGLAAMGPFGGGSDRQRDARRAGSHRIRRDPLGCHTLCLGRWPSRQVRGSRRGPMISCNHNPGSRSPCSRAGTT